MDDITLALIILTIPISILLIIHFSSMQNCHSDKDIHIPIRRNVVRIVSIYVWSIKRVRALINLFKNQSFLNTT